MTPDRIVSTLTAPTRVKEHTRSRPKTAQERMTRIMIAQVYGKEQLELATQRAEAEMFRSAEEFPAQTIAELREEQPRSWLRRAMDWVKQFEVV